VVLRPDNKVEAASAAASITSLGSMVVVMACRRAVLDHPWDPGRRVVLGVQLDLQGRLVPEHRVGLGVLAALAGPQNIQPM
jgi:hypothetical protein